LFSAEDPLAPPSDAFDEAWQAQVLAIAATMVEAGHFTLGDWAAALGGELAAANDQPDTLQTYYLCALSALEKLSDDHANITAQSQARRKADWVTAYENTPHGRPVALGAPPSKTQS